MFRVKTATDRVKTANFSKGLEGIREVGYDINMVVCV